MNTYLNNCPFCGNEAYIVSDFYTKGYEVICSHCGARSAPCRYGKSKLPVGGKKLKNDEQARAEAVRLWNNRR